MTPAASKYFQLALPASWRTSTLVGRIDFGEGPTPVVLREGRVHDFSAEAPTVSDLLALHGPGSALPPGRDRGAVEALDFTAEWEPRGANGIPKLLSPIDLQCIKAAGVTFAVSALERVIEERARGDSSRAESIRAGLAERIGTDLRSVKPGSVQAAKLKDALIADGLWSQYLEVAIGPDAEVFTKAPLLSSVGWGAHIGVRSDSHWNNPEPEIVLVCDPQGRARGAMLGNDVNLRDIEGRSALLLGKAKDNNASCALGPFIRLFDENYSLDDVRSAHVGLEIRGEEGYVLEGRSSMSEISRDPLELVAQTIGAHHQYPDGFALFLGTLFAPVQDRDAPGRGFTHKSGDRVRISNEALGVLENRVVACDAAPPWRFGVSALMQNLARRDLLKGH